MKYQSTNEVRLMAVTGLKDMAGPILAIRTYIAAAITTRSIFHGN